MGKNPSPQPGPVFALVDTKSHWCFESILVSCWTKANSRETRFQAPSARVNFYVVQTSKLASDTERASTPFPFWTKANFSHSLRAKALNLTPSTRINCLPVGNERTRSDDGEREIPNRIYRICAHLRRI